MLRYWEMDMSKVALRSDKRTPRQPERKSAAVVAPAPPAGDFISFRHSYVEISSFAGKTRLKSKRTQFVDGRLTAEAFEGEAGPGAYDELVGRVRQHFLAQAALMLQSLSWFLPTIRDRRSDDE